MSYLSTWEPTYFSTYLTYCYKARTMVIMRNKSSLGRLSKSIGVTPKSFLVPGCIYRFRGPYGEVYYQASLYTEPAALKPNTKQWAVTKRVQPLSGTQRTDRQSFLDY